MACVMGHEGWKVPAKPPGGPKWPTNLSIKLLLNCSEHHAITLMISTCVSVNLWLLLLGTRALGEVMV